MVKEQRLKTILNLLGCIEEALHRLNDLNDGKDEGVREAILGLHSVRELTKTQFKELQECQIKIQTLLA